MKRIGILGGTFNPVHVGHLSMAQEAREKMNIEKVVFVPSYLPPHKSSEGIAPARHRLAMLRLAVKGNPSFEVSDFEIKREGRSYSIDTVEYFFGKFAKGTKLYFIVGADMVPGLKKWKRFKDIIKMAMFVAVDRPGSRKKGLSATHYLKIVPSADVSSSEVRRRISQAKSIKYLVPDSVDRYIKRKRLYQ